ncbi:glycosyltransferase family 4 protein [Paenibacillus hexagrammi]|uniref:Glycosyltransferase family 4 protein n=1 Tax=Paenibacillus hexagrammi TaxID=2908839 RepID=A0ABY3SDP3_9BACL|nr:glycosyltransferase family 4 protein [Paenibacillus sp. YPD9-1]UJF32099.1 glycosyltransferase family 4 protein [Paenibacillus sp. YPD9-1]
MNILLDGKFYNGHGLAEGNRILLRILHKAGFRVRIAPRDREEKHTVLPPEEIAFISSFEHVELPSNDIYIYNWIGAGVKYNPEFRINIARTTFETDRIPASWVPELNAFDEVWVQSTFNLQTFLSSGVRVPLRLIPNFFDIGQFQPEGPTLDHSFSESFRFLSIFDLKKRKGYDVLLNAYLNEFSIDDDVALIMKVRDNNRNERIEQFIAGHPKPAEQQPRIYMIDHMMLLEDMLKLYRVCDAFVLPTRGEGWGRPFFEAMLMELPSIGTEWSGHTEFMNSGNSYFIRVKKLIQIENELPMFNGHYWAEPSMKDLQRKMRHVFENREEAREKGKRARRELLEKFHEQEVAQRVMREINKFKILV